jgi:phenolic acid decarboxylase
MVLYNCNKCGREFGRKSTFDFHINRKFSCVKIEPNKNPITYTELQNTNEELEDEIKQIQNLTDENIELQNKNKELEDKIKQLEDKTLILYTQNKEKQELLNNKDIEIKNLYQNKNTKNKDDGDIKIKMVQGYVYIIRECDFVRLNEDIYKIGRTAKTNPEDRFQKYRKGTEIIGFFKVNDSIECENKIIKCFSNHANITKMNEYGKEYFQGDKNELLNEMLQIVKHYNK